MKLLLLSLLPPVLLPCFPSLLNFFPINRKDIWAFAMKNVEEGCFMPTWAILFRLALFPLSTLDGIISGQSIFDIFSYSIKVQDTKWSLRSLELLAYEAGKNPGIYWQIRKSPLGYLEFQQFLPESTDGYPDW
jgi:hypothetical protein